MYVALCLCLAVIEWAVCSVHSNRHCSIPTCAPLFRDTLELRTSTSDHRLMSTRLEWSDLTLSAEASPYFRCRRLRPSALRGVDTSADGSRHRSTVLSSCSGVAWPGRVLAVMGQSGAGKSSLVRVDNGPACHARGPSVQKMLCAILWSPMRCRCSATNVAARSEWCPRDLQTAANCEDTLPNNLNTSHSALIVSCSLAPGI